MHFADPRCKALRANVHGVDKGENRDLQLERGQEICSDEGNQLGKNVCNAGKITIGCSDREGAIVNVT